MSDQLGVGISKDEFKIQEQIVANSLAELFRKNNPKSDQLIEDKKRVNETKTGKSSKKKLGASAKLVVRSAPPLRLLAINGTNPSVICDDDRTSSPEVRKRKGMLTTAAAAAKHNQERAAIIKRLKPLSPPLPSIPDNMKWMIEFSEQIKSSYVRSLRNILRCFPRCYQDHLHEDDPSSTCRTKILVKMSTDKDYETSLGVHFQPFLLLVPEK